MLLLNQSNSIGNEFVHYLQERIHQLTIPEDIRDSLFQNLNKLSTNYILVDRYSSTRQYHFVT